jgi:hypothetical protein
VRDRVGLSLWIDVYCSDLACTVTLWLDEHTSAKRSIARACLCCCALHKASHSFVNLSMML